MKKFPTILALLAIIAGCAKEPAVLPVEEGGLVAYSFTATLPPADVKSTISDEGKFSWSAGDEIAVFNSAAGTFVTFKSEAGDGNFTAQATPGAVFTTAYYPAAIAVASNPNAIALPTDYTQTVAAAGKTFPMKATANGSVLEFDHLASLLKLTVNDVPAEATMLTLSSTKALGGVFEVGKDGNGEDAILASNGSGDIEIELSNSAKSNVTVYVPVPVGSYSYTLSVGDGSVIMLSKSTTSDKTLERGSLHILKALTVTPPTTDKSLIGHYTYSGTQYDWGTASIVPFAAVDGHWGWFKASVAPHSLGQISFKLYKSDGDVYTGSTLPNERKIVGTLIPVADDGNGNDIQIFTNRSELDIYYNPASGQLFSLPAGNAFHIPATAAGEEIDAYALIGFHQEDNWASDFFLEAVEGQNEWRVVNIGAAGEDPHFSIKFRKNGEWSNQIGGVFKYSHALNTRLFARPSNNCDFDVYPGVSGRYDVYVKTDMSTVFVLPAGSDFSIPERLESEDLVSQLYIVGGLNGHNWDMNFPLEFASSSNHDWYVLRNASKIPGWGAMVFKIYNNTWNPGTSVGFSNELNPNGGFIGNKGVLYPLWLRDGNDDIPNIQIDPADGQVDIYIKADLSQIFTLPAGSDFAVPGTI